MLPQQYKYENISITPLEEDKYVAKFRANIRSREQVEKWVEDLKATSLLDYSVDKGFVRKGSTRVLFKVGDELSLNVFSIIYHTVV